MSTRISTPRSSPDRSGARSLSLRVPAFAFLDSAHESRHMSDIRKDLGIGMVGYAFMGAAHSQAWRTAPAFFDLPLHPKMRAICGRNEDAAGDVAQRFGWESVETDWRALLRRDDIDLIDICTPGNTHAEIAIAALEAGKHVLCEKPLANTVAEAREMTRAAAAA